MHHEATECATLAPEPCNIRRDVTWFSLKGFWRKTKQGKNLEESKSKKLITKCNKFTLYCELFHREDDSPFAVTRQENKDVTVVAKPLVPSPRTLVAERFNQISNLPPRCRRERPVEHERRRRLHADVSIAPPQHHAASIQRVNEGVERKRLDRALREAQYMRPQLARFSGCESEETQKRTIWRAGGKVFQIHPDGLFVGKNNDQQNQIE